MQPPSLPVEEEEVALQVLADRPALHHQQPLFLLGLHLQHLPPAGQQRADPLAMLLRVFTLSLSGRAG